MSELGSDRNIVLRNVSKFYGEVLGVNRVDLDIEPGITSLVGPNGSARQVDSHEPDRGSAAADRG